MQRVRFTASLLLARPATRLITSFLGSPGGGGEGTRFANFGRNVNKSMRFFAAAASKYIFSFLPRFLHLRTPCRATLFAFVFFPPPKQKGCRGSECVAFWSSLLDTKDICLSKAHSPSILITSGRVSVCCVFTFSSLLLEVLCTQRCYSAEIHCKPALLLDLTPPF